MLVSGSRIGRRGKSGQYSWMHIKDHETITADWDERGKIKAWVVNHFIKPESLH